MKIQTFKHRRPEESIKRLFERHPVYRDLVGKDREVAESLLRSERFDGQIVRLIHAFGCHLSVSTYDGENIFTLVTTGGHAMHGVLIVQKCDSPIMVVHLDMKSDDPLEKLREAIGAGDVIECLNRFIDGD